MERWLEIWDKLLEAGTRAAGRLGVPTSYAPFDRLL